MGGKIACPKARKVPFYLQECSEELSYTWPLGIITIFHCAVPWAAIDCAELRAVENRLHRGQQLKQILKDPGIMDVWGCEGQQGSVERTGTAERKEMDKEEEQRKTKGLNANGEKRKHVQRFTEDFVKERLIWQPVDLALHSLFLHQNPVPAV
ncbi:hypothetical protein B0H19DRAFT_1075900 [Mycena capillaripes]|nr:hypothetical protein B0H19DRAFT_1075900 [Mycena capillaripes]